LLKAAYAVITLGVKGMELKGTRRSILSAAAISVALAFAGQAAMAATAVEKPQLTLGFIKLTDMAPLAVAKELHYFEDEGLSVRLELQAN